MPLHEPEGATTKSQPSNSSISFRASAMVSARSPELYAGWPQQVCVAGTTTSAPPDSSSRNAANPIEGRMRSTRHVTNNPIFMRRALFHPSIELRLNERHRAESHERLGQDT